MAAKKSAKEAKTSKAGAVSKEETIGYHKGSIAVLAKEREELARILGIVEQLMQMHVAALKELGVDLEKEAAALGAANVIPAGKSPTKPRNKPPIEDVI